MACHKCTCKDALVLEARQEGQGFTPLVKAFDTLNPRAPGSRLFCACAAERLSTAPCQTSDPNSRYLHPNPVPEPRRCVTTLLQTL